MDILTTVERSKQMSRVKGKDTLPELIVRRLTHSMGFRYRLHVRNLPGKPDLVFASRHKIIFVHGCFWHRHDNCILARMPKSRLDFWRPKLERNRVRDMETLQRLAGLRWKVLVIWECELNDREAVAKRIRHFLEESES